MTKKLILLYTATVLVTVSGAQTPCVRIKNFTGCLRQEEIAAVNLAKYRKLQHDLEESEARAELAENVVGQMRSKGRTSTVTETTSVCKRITYRQLTFESNQIY